MPVFRFMRKVNRRLFNPIEIKRGRRPVLIHKGRRSGAEYHTPLDASAVDGGYVFTIMYGADCDWVQNILRSGEATLRIDGRDVDLDSPRLIDESELEQALGREPDLPPSFLNVSEFLQMNVVS